MPIVQVVSEVEIVSVVLIGSIVVTFLLFELLQYFDSFRSSSGFSRLLIFGSLCSSCWLGSFCSLEILGILWTCSYCSLCCLRSFVSRSFCNLGSFRLCG